MWVNVTKSKNLLTSKIIIDIPGGPHLFSFLESTPFDYIKSSFCFIFDPLVVFWYAYVSM